MPVQVQLCFTIFQVIEKCIGKEQGENGEVLLAASLDGAEIAALSCKCFIGYNGVTVESHFVRRRKRFPINTCMNCWDVEPGLYHKPEKKKKYHIVPEGSRIQRSVTFDGVIMDTSNTEASWVIKSSV